MFFICSLFSFPVFGKTMYTIVNIQRYKEWDMSRLFWHMYSVKEIELSGKGLKANSVNEFSDNIEEWV